FHVRQKSILLRLIKPVHFIHKHNRPPPVVPRALRRRHHLFNFLNSRKHRAERNKIRTRAFRVHTSKSSLPASGRTQKKQRANIVALDLHSQRFPRPKKIFLANKFIQRLRTHAIGQRTRPRILFLRLARPEKTQEEARSARRRAA